MYWERVLREVRNKNSKGFKCYFIHPEKKSVSVEKISSKLAVIKREYRRYSVGVYHLGEKQNHIYFTRREAECMVELLKGKTNAEIARVLNLSPRTVEFYLKNMKCKLKCRTRTSLVEKVLNSEFMNNVDFI